MAFSRWDVLPDIDLASPAVMEHFNSRAQSSDPSGCLQCLGHGEAPFQELCLTLESPQSSGLPPPPLAPHSKPFQQLERSLRGEKSLPLLLLLRVSESQCVSFPACS